MIRGFFKYIVPSWFGWWTIDGKLANVRIVYRGTEVLQTRRVSVQRFYLFGIPTLRREVW